MPTKPSIQSLSEQLKPIASAVRQRIPIIRPVSQILLKISKQKGRDPFIAAQHSILTWMNRRAGKPLPKEAWEGQSFALEDIGAQRTAAVSIGEPRYWAARLDDSDKEIAQRVWVTEIGIGESSEGEIIFGTRLISVTRGDDEAYNPSIPVFVKDVI